jgi:hypothetical protein
MDEKSRETSQRIIAPVRFQVLVNGEQVALAGVDDFGTLFAEVMWIKRDPSLFPKDEAHFTFDEWCEEKLDVQVFGSRRTNAFREFCKVTGLKPGDEVVVRILGPGECDRGTGA